MDDDKAAAKGLSGARTGGAPRENAPAGAASDANLHGRSAGAVDLAGAIAEIAGAIDQADGDQGDLLDGSPDLGDLDVLAQAAETIAAPRRARGRPKGSANKRNDRVFDYLEALGHRNPAVTLSLIQTADTGELARRLSSPLVDSKGNPVMTPVLDEHGRVQFDKHGDVITQVVYAGADPVKVLVTQEKAASRLMDFGFAKKPQKVEVDERKLHLFVSGQIGGEGPRGGGLSLFGDAKEINGLAVRQTDNESHGSEKASDNRGMSDESD